MLHWLRDMILPILNSRSTDNTEVHIRGGLTPTYVHYKHTRFGVHSVDAK